MLFNKPHFWSEYEENRLSPEKEGLKEGSFLGQMYLCHREKSDVSMGHPEVPQTQPTASRTDLIPPSVCHLVSCLPPSTV